mmetsp:Transcript_41986/g.113226  ORF Transcript_41986/g.113226 Transcript_41986/m.113226 type:complete len:215 (-) Transcript_41986:2454-3098(-)
MTQDHALHFVPLVVLLGARHHIVGPAPAATPMVHDRAQGLVVGLILLEAVLRRDGALQAYLGIPHQQPASIPVCDLSVEAAHRFDGKLAVAGRADPLLVEHVQRPVAQACAVGHHQLASVLVHVGPGQEDVADRQLHVVFVQGHDLAVNVGGVVVAVVGLLVLRRLRLVLGHRVHQVVGEVLHDKRRQRPHRVVEVGGLCDRLLGQALLQRPRA